MQKHGEQKRAIGDPYFSHPLEVAAILTDLKLDDATIAVALLHDTIEDTDATRAEIDQLFGEDIGRLVEGLTKLKQARPRLEGRRSRRRTCASCCSRSPTTCACCWSSSPTACTTCARSTTCRRRARRRIAEETLEIYAPLAGRMGMHDMREELEELAFREHQSGSLRGDQRSGSPRWQRAATAV